MTIQFSFFDEFNIIHSFYLLLRLINFTVQLLKCNNASQSLENSFDSGIFTPISLAN